MIMKDSLFDCFSIFGVKITTVSQRRAFTILESLLNIQSNNSHIVFFANANTLNLAYRDSKFKEILNSSIYTFPDGIGVKIGACICGKKCAENLAGTDLIPSFLKATANKSYKYYLLGGTTDSINHASEQAVKLFPGWRLVGHHQGYLDSITSDQIIANINLTSPHLLLVGMGSPTQEQWIHKAQERLRVPLCVAVGGLFNYWTGNLRRAPLFLRCLGLEWTWILFNQPWKWKRYLIGNWQYLFRIGYEHYLKSSR